MNRSKTWDERYDMADYAYGIQPNDFLAESIHLLPKGEALSLAEGEGRNAVFLAQQGFDVTAVDSSKIGVKKAQQLAQSKNVQANFIHADVNRFELGEEQWDLIISIFVPLPEQHRIALHKRVTEALKPGGVFLIEAYRPEQAHRDTGGGRSPEVMQTAETIRNDLPTLDILHLEELHRDVLEGIYHTGTGAVVQAITRKPQG